MCLSEPAQRTTGNDAASDAESAGCARRSTETEWRRPRAQRRGRDSRRPAAVQAASDAAGKQRDEGLSKATRQPRRPDSYLTGHPAVADDTRGFSIGGRFDWNEYKPAIRRWEYATGRAAPHPIEAGIRGQPRLASCFVEWLMGLPAGFVTALGLPRGAELRALGNGVVPQQAESALRELVAAVRQLHNN